MTVDPRAVHEAMQSAPHDGQPYRMARAAIATVNIASATALAAAEQQRDEAVGLLRLLLLDGPAAVSALAFLSRLDSEGKGKP